jgi:hypothetical protein
VVAQTLKKKEDKPEKATLVKEMKIMLIMF